GKDVKPRPILTEVKQPAEKMDAVAGQYELRPGFVLKVWREGEQMMTQATGQGKVPVFALSEYRYFSRTVDAQLEFKPGADGKAAGLVLHQNGRQTEAKKIGE
ncbi:MAG TPA: DUF3471 domain-containing protein, partial [Bryobacteraceae bacterium]|nr:DUF3471 domain-containing protein [Bryobacteraceae bacterium]